MPLQSFEGPNSNLAPVFLLTLTRIKARTTTSTCTFSTGHFDRQVPRVACHFLYMLGKWLMADRYIEPWVFILEEAQKGTLTSQSATEAAKAALMLLGNASAQMAMERQKKVTKDLHKDLMLLTEDPEMFEEVAPLLFGASFEKKMKDHLESPPTVNGPKKWLQK